MLVFQLPRVTTAKTKLLNNSVSLFYLFSGYSPLPFLSVDTDGTVFQLGGTFSAVPGTAKYGGNFLAVMKYGGTTFDVNLLLPI